jgi:transcriptional regulator EpsA
LITLDAPQVTPMNVSAGLHTVDPYSSVQAEALVRIIESASQVRRRNHFFLWSQNLLQTFLPHRVAVCAAYNRQAKDLAFDAFYSVPVPQPLLAILTDAQSPLLRQIVLDWIARRGRCTTIDLAAMRSRLGAEPVDAIVEAGLAELLVHGVARPHRPTEIESLFVLAAPVGQQWTANHHAVFDLLLPHIHTTYLRVQVNEHELATGVPAPTRLRSADAGSPITRRESEILMWVRDGLSNQQIGSQLSISALTVKNHLQKILRKLGASNRAQAVALAISQSLIASGRTPDRP